MRTVLLLLALSFAGLGYSKSEVPSAVRVPRLSAFHNHIADMAREKGVSIAEAVKAAKSWGIEGVDVFSAFDHGEADEILAAGMVPSTYILSADFAHTNDEEKVERALAFVKRTGCPRIMLVAGYLNKGEDRETGWQTMKPRIASLVKRAAELKVKVELEDFDDRMQVVGSSAHLRRAFAEIPGLGHVFDTGNYSYWKEDAAAALREFRDRIGHVHVKDVSSEGRSVASGTGVLPIRKLIADLKRGGYSNWLTIECFGVTNVWGTVETSARFLRSALSADDAVVDFSMAAMPLRPELHSSGMGGQLTGGNSARFADLKPCRSFNKPYFAAKLFGLVLENCDRRAKVVDWDVENPVQAYGYVAKDGRRKFVLVSRFKDGPTSFSIELKGLGAAKCVSFLALDRVHDLEDLVETAFVCDEPLCRREGDRLLFTVRDPASVAYLLVFDR